MRQNPPRSHHRYTQGRLYEIHEEIVDRGPGKGKRRRLVYDDPPPPATTRRSARDWIGSNSPLPSVDPINRIHYRDFRGEVDGAPITDERVFEDLKAEKRQTTITNRLGRMYALKQLAWSEWLYRHGIITEPGRIVGENHEFVWEGELSPAFYWVGDAVYLGDVETDTEELTSSAAQEVAENPVLLAEFKWLLDELVRSTRIEEGELYHELWPEYVDWIAEGKRDPVGLLALVMTIGENHGLELSELAARAAAEATRTEVALVVVDVPDLIKWSEGRTHDQIATETDRFIGFCREMAAEQTGDPERWIEFFESAWRAYLDEGGRDWYIAEVELSGAPSFWEDEDIPF